MFDNEWGGAVAMTKIEGVWMYGPWVMNNPQRLVDGNWHTKSHECVAIAQETLRMANAKDFWYRESEFWEMRHLPIINGWKFTELALCEELLSLLLMRQVAIQTKFTAIMWQLFISKQKCNKSYRSMEWATSP